MASESRRAEATALTVPSPPAATRVVAPRRRASRAACLGSSRFPTRIGSGCKPYRSNVAISSFNGREPRNPPARWFTIKLIAEPRPAMRSSSASAAWAASSKLSYRSIARFPAPAVHARDNWSADVCGRAALQRPPVATRAGPIRGVSASPPGPSRRGFILRQREALALVQPGQAGQNENRVFILLFK